MVLKDFNALTIIGMGEKEAMETLLANGISVRLAERNGVVFGGVESKAENRMSLFIADDRVFKFVVG